MLQLRRLGFAAVAAAMLASPGLGYAQAGPNFVCDTQNLLIGAAEMSGVRVSCSVSGAPAGDQTLRVLGDRPQPVCEAALSGGAAECVGTLIDSTALGQVVAELLPSGLQFQVLPAPPNGQGAPSLQYTPIPSGACPPQVDEPAPDAGST